MDGVAINNISRLADSAFLTPPAELTVRWLSKGAQSLPERSNIYKSLPYVCSRNPILPCAFAPEMDLRITGKPLERDVRRSKPALGAGAVRGDTISTSKRTNPRVAMTKPGANRCEQLSPSCVSLFGLSSNPYNYSVDSCSLAVLFLFVFVCFALVF